MKTIGILGGMSWESTVEYYRIINQEIGRRLGASHSAKIMLNSVDFEEIEQLQHQDKWDKLSELMLKFSLQLQHGGADCLVIATNTMHKLVPEIETRIDIPIIHIADATGEKIREAGLNTIGLLGTRFTMKEDFYKGRLQNRFELDILIPKPRGIDTVHHIIYKELIHGKIMDESREKYKNIMEQMISEGIEGVILGCTEIGLLIKETDVSVPVFDTTEIHAKAAVDFALN